MSFFFIEVLTLPQLKQICVSAWWYVLKATCPDAGNEYTADELGEIVMNGVYTINGEGEPFDVAVTQKAGEQYLFKN